MKSSALSAAAFEAPDLIGQTEVMKGVGKAIARVAPYSTTVLILGETGTGKEVVARQIHAQSKRADLPFIAVNCAAINANLIESELFGHVQGAFTDAKAYTPGYFEAAGEGTLFLDEIQSLPKEAQAKVLRAIHDKLIRPVGYRGPELQVKARVVVAANEDLDEMVERGEFREDLHYRLKRFIVRIPPLRERVEDIPDFVAKLFPVLRERNEIPDLPYTISPDGLEYLRTQPFWGNVRELSGLLTTAALRAEPPDRTELNKDDLEAAVRLHHNGHTDTLGSGAVTQATFNPDYTKLDELKKITVGDIAHRYSWNDARLFFRRLYTAILYHTQPDLSHMQLASRSTSHTIKNHLGQIRLQLKDKKGVETLEHKVPLNSETKLHQLNADELPVYELLQLPYNEADELFKALFIRENAAKVTNRKAFTSQYGTPQGLDQVMSYHHIVFSHP